MPHEYSVVKSDKNIFKKRVWILKPKSYWEGIKTKTAHKQYCDGISATNLS